MVHKSATRHVLINKHLHWILFFIARVVPNEFDQIWMMHLRQQIHLRQYAKYIIPSASFVFIMKF